MVLRYLSVLLCLGFSLSLFSQIQITYPKGKKELYNAGEKIEIIVRLKSLPETCQAGMKQAKVFVSGLAIETQSDWKELSKGFWQKQMTLSVIDNNKKSAKLTVMRKVDKESLFHQETLNVAGK